MKTSVVLLGATGSIGQNTIQVLREQKERFQLFGISAHQNTKKLQEIQKEFHVSHAVLTGKNGNFECESKELQRLATLPEADLIVFASSGISCLEALLAAIDHEKIIALANKECVVAAGNLIKEHLDAHHKCKIFPIDSEHNAIFQCLKGENPRLFYPNDVVESITLTASGGPFLNKSEDELAHISYEQAICHPTWKMGTKISVDSATLANKGLEVIEAAHFFQLQPQQIHIVVHPESVIHSLVNFVDGSTLAQLSLPNMRLPIAYCLNQGKHFSSSLPKISLTSLKKLTFQEPNREKFPCLALAERALLEGDNKPCVFNAANEAAVTLFSEKKISFLEIPKRIQCAMDNFPLRKLSDVQLIYTLHQEVKRFVFDTRL